jgi:protein phosphatase
MQGDNVKNRDKFPKETFSSCECSFKIESYGISDVGCVRQNNEDIWAEMPDYQFYILADGMGGHKAGEVAARQAVIKVCESLERFFRSSHKPTFEKIEAALKQAIIEANSWVYKLSREHEEFRGMGTTLCCFLLHDRTLIYAHVGDSRIYHFRKKLNLMTTDHSLRNELMQKRHLSEEEAATFLFKNIITRAIGTCPTVEPEIGSRLVESGEIFFLCSDGLTDYVSESEMSNILKKNYSLKETSDELVKLAKEKGGNDNITIVMIKIKSE